MTRTIIFSALLGLLVMPSVTFGQSAQQQAKALYNDGTAHYTAGRYLQAIDAFKKAYQIKPIPVLLRTLAKVYGKLDDLPKSIDYYRRYLSTQPKDAAKIRPKVARLSATMATWPSLNLSSTPQGATIRVGSETARIHGRTPTTLRLAPKRQIIVLQKPGYRTVSRPILFEAGTHRSMTITLSSLQAKAAPVAAAPTPGTGAALVVPTVPTLSVPKVPAVPVVQAAAVPARPAAAPQVQAAPPIVPAVPIPVIAPSIPGTPPSQGSGSTTPAPVLTIPGATTDSSSGESAGLDMRLWAWVGIGTGAALVLGGSITGAMAVGAKGDLDTCQGDPSCQRTTRESDLAGDVQSQAMVTDVLITTGALVAGTGLLLYFLAGDSSAPDTPTVTVVPTPVGATAVGQIRF